MGGAIAEQSMWFSSVTNWFTPIVLFCILNLTIGTIFLTSRVFKTSTEKKHEKENGSDDLNNPASPPLFRTPSTLLERVKSINFSFKYHYQYQYSRSSSSGRAPDPLEISPQNDVVDGSRELSGDSPESHLHVPRRSQSESSAAAAVPIQKMKKSASEKLVSLENRENIEEEEQREVGDVVDRRRPATTREREKPANLVVDEEVDEKANDFINRFRQQLKLQRLESILRYKEMLNRGAGK